MRTKAGGYTLLEGLFSLALVSIVMTALGYVLVQAERVRSNMGNMDRSSEVVHALFLIKNDLQAAQTVTSPAASSSGSQIVLTRVDPARSFLQRTDFPGDPNDPYEPEDFIEVEFRVVNGVLMREVRYSDGTGTSERLLEVVSFRAELVGGLPGVITYSVVSRHARGQQTHTMKAAVRL